MKTSLKHVSMSKYVEYKIFQKIKTNLKTNFFIECTLNVDRKNMFEKNLIRNCLDNFFVVWRANIRIDCGPTFSFRNLQQIFFFCQLQHKLMVSQQIKPVK